MTQTIEQGALDHPNVKAIKAYQSAMAQGDVESALHIFQPDVKYIVPGNNHLSGNYEGPQAVMGYFGRLMELTQGTYRITQQSWLVNDLEQVLLETHNYAELAGRSYEWDEAILFTFRDGKKARIDLFQANQAGVDEFFGK